MRTSFSAIARTLRRRPVGEAYRGLCEAAREATGSDHAALLFLNPVAADLEVLYGSGEGWEEAQGRRLALAASPSTETAGVAAATGSSVVTGEAEERPDAPRVFRAARSEIAEPVRDDDGRVRAVLSLDSARPGAYGARERDIVAALADLCGAAIERADQEAREEALIEIGSALDQVLTEDDLIERVVKIAEDTLRLHSCSIFLFDAAERTVWLKGTIGALREQTNLIGYEKGEGFTGWVAAHGKPILLDDPQTDPRWRGKFVEIPSESISSFLAVPILSGDRTLGVVRALRRKPENPHLDNRFTDRDLRLLQAIAEQLATGIRISRYVERALRDERMIAWGELSAKSSHMIGNRVFALKGDVNELAHLLDEAGHRDGDLPEIQASLKRNILRIDELLQDFRDFLTATQLDLAPGDVGVIVRETCVELNLAAHGLRLDLSVEPALPCVDLDGRRLRRAFSELIENATHFCRPGGRVGVSVGTREGGVVVAVEDDGPGVPADRKSRIFEPFFSGRVKGMGLGLSIVKGIVDAHGGRIAETGRPGQGARFEIELPVKTS